MSLLLQALQKAAKNREAGSAAAEESSPSPPPAPEAALEPPSEILPPTFALDARKDPDRGEREPELALADEDLFEPDESLPESAQRFEPFGAIPAASPADAAAILRASETPKAGWIDWIRERPVWAFAVAAAVFLLFYAVYVYLQIAHPGLLRGEFAARPLTANTPPPPPLPSSKPMTAQHDPPTTAAPKASVTQAVQESPAAIAPLSPVPSITTAAATRPPQAPATAASKPLAAGQPRSVPAQNKSANMAAREAVPQIIAASPDALDQELREGTANPEQAYQSAPSVAQHRAPKKPTPAVVSSPSMEHEISSKPADAGTPSVTPAVKEAYQALQEGHVEQAEKAYRKALENEAQNVDALLGLAAIAAQRGQIQQAIGFYERALEIEPRNPTAQAGLISLIGQADPQASETRLKQLIAREPSALLFYSLGNLYAGQNQWPAAQQAYFQAFQLQSDNADYAYNLAIGLEHLSQPKLALGYYRKAIELSFQKGRASFDQNRVIERIGQLAARYD